jgi:hypothetical protein
LVTWKVITIFTKPFKTSGFLFDKNVKNFTMTKYETTQKVKKTLENNTKDDVAKDIGISRPTLDARLQWHTWKIAEITHIKNWKL